MITIDKLAPKVNNVIPKIKQIELIEKDTDAYFKLPVKYDSFNRFGNSEWANFEPLKQRAGYFNSDYSLFTALGITYTIQEYELLGNHYIDFISNNETYNFTFEGYDLAAAKW